MKYLIVSADDFGLAKNINEGIIKAYKEGVVTCVNLMPSGEAFDDALKLTRMIGLNEIGAHLALTQTKPLTEIGKIPTLLAKDGSFCQNYTEFFLRFIRNRIDLEQVYTELKSQINVLQMAGLRITNLSSHEHIHMAPVILDIFVKLARECRIPAIRFLHKENSFHIKINHLYKNIILFCLEGRVKKILNASSICSPDNFSGFLHSGKLKEEMVLRIIESLEEGTTELVCHPAIIGPDVLKKYGFHKNGELELSALTGNAVKRLINDRKIQLLSYGEFLLKNKGNVVP
jgi:chitin disaccharide deacetylase